MNSDREGHLTDPFGEPFGEDGLEALFAEARAAPPAPLPAALQARLVEAALAARVPTAAPGWRARLRALLADLGGAPSLAGVGVAGLAGIWIGIAAPGPTGDLVSTFWQGAAGVAPVAADWVAADSTLDYSGTEILSLLDSETD